MTGIAVLGDDESTHAFDSPEGVASSDYLVHYAQARIGVKFAHFERASGALRRRMSPVILVRISRERVTCLLCASGRYCL